MMTPTTCIMHCHVLMCRSSETLHPPPKGFGQQRQQVLPFGCESVSLPRESPPSITGGSPKLSLADLYDCCGVRIQAIYE